MPGRSRHGLHVVGDGVAPAAEQITPALQSARGRLCLSLHQQSVVLAIGGRLNADTAGRLRMFLSMFTIDGGPQELVLDLSDVVAVDEDGMAPIFEADESMRLRTAPLRLASVSAAVAHYLDDLRCGRILATGSPPEVASPDPAGGPTGSALDNGRLRPGQDCHDH
jgi:anti-anti-sigma regulatory factor